MIEDLQDVVEKMEEQQPYVERELEGKDFNELASEVNDYIDNAEEVARYAKKVSAKVERFANNYRAVIDCRHTNLAELQEIIHDFIYEMGV